MQIKLTPAVNVVDQRDYSAHLNAEASLQNDIRLAVSPVDPVPQSACCASGGGVLSLVRACNGPLRRDTLAVAGPLL